MALSSFEESAAGILKENKDFLEGAVESAVTILDEVLDGDELKKHLSNVPIKARTEEDALQELMSETEVYLTSHPQFRDHIMATGQKFHEEFEAMVTTMSHDYNNTLGPLTGLNLLTQAVRFSYSKFWLHVAITTLLVALIPELQVAAGLVILAAPFAVIYAGFEMMATTSAEQVRSQLCDGAITAMGNDQKLYSIAKQSLCRCFERLDELETDLEAQKKLDERLVEERFAETRNQQDLVATYEPHVCGITLQLGRLAIVELAEMREYEFDLDGIIGWPDPQNRIAVGSYGEVYRVQVQRGESPVPAALKVGVLPYAITTEENAWEFVNEENNLRTLRGDHIVEYYGTACRKEEGGLRLGLVMELCEGTLDSRIIGQREHNPALWGHDSVMKQRAFNYIQDKAIQLCEGLRTIHDAGYIHRDLKLINILVTAGDVVKLADVGVTKRDADVTGTMTGTATYAAPEVKERKVYDKTADIYSLGLILWEMWYGRTMDDRSLSGLTEGDSRMMPQFPDSIRPIPDWETLVRDCVNTDLSRRPSALECLRRIRDMTTEDSSQHSMPVSTV